MLINIKYEPFELMRYNGSFWFRIFGYGIAGKNIKIHKLFFSERNNIVKHYLVGNWSFKFLGRK